MPENVRLPCLNCIGLPFWMWRPNKKPTNWLGALRKKFMPESPFRNVSHIGKTQSCTEPFSKLRCAVSRLKKRSLKFWPWVRGFHIPGPSIAHKNMLTVSGLFSEAPVKKTFQSWESKVLILRFPDMNRIPLQAEWQQRLRFWNRSLLVEPKVRNSFFLPKTMSCTTGCQSENFVAMKILIGIFVQQFAWTGWKSSFPKWGWLFLHSASTWEFLFHRCFPKYTLVTWSRPWPSCMATDWRAFNGEKPSAR